MRTSTITSVLLASAASVLATPTIAFVNHCKYDITYNIVTGTSSGPQNTIAAGATWAAPWTPNAQVSIKMGKAGANGVLQFEYNQYGSNNFWYDFSAIDGNPFADQNIKVSPTGTGSASSDGVSGCQKIKLHANQLSADFFQPNNCYQDANGQKHTGTGAGCANGAQIFPEPGNNCPTNTGTFWIDMCDPNINSRSVSFSS